MPVLRIATINILSDLSFWDQRRDLLRAGLQALDLDVIALQEARLPEDTAGWLADRLGFAYVHLSPSNFRVPPPEGIAILSRHPIVQMETLSLEGQGRVAQAARISLEQSEVIIANGHFFWQPGESIARDRQIDDLIGWLGTLADGKPAIICGDFNGTPETRAIERMRQFYRSAYASVNGREPEYTTPTPLPHSLLYYLLTAVGIMKYIRLKDLSWDFRGTLDYIFVKPGLDVLEAKIVLNQPGPQNPRIYPSDHYGIFARIEV